MIDLQKRRLVTKIAGGVIALPAAVGFAREFVFAQGTRPPQGVPQQSPPPPTPPGDPSPIPTSEFDPKLTLQRNQAQIRQDVEKLYALAGELKDEVEKTQTTQVLSLPMIQKAEQIEKLAKQVKTMARGN